MTDVIHRTLLVFVLLLNGRDYLQRDGALRLRLQPEVKKKVYKSVFLGTATPSVLSDLCNSVKI